MNGAALILLSFLAALTVATLTAPIVVSGCGVPAADPTWS